MDKKTGKPFITGSKEATAMKEFTAEKKNCDIEIEFKIDSSALADQTIVAFEELIHNNVTVDTHADLEDKDQSIYYPACETELKDDKGNKEMKPSEKTVLIDSVEYKNLIPGRKYTVTGKLMDKATEEPLSVNGEPVLATAEFTPEERDGKVEVQFIINTTKLQDNNELVAFERIDDENGNEVVSHEDINDEAQTVKITPNPHNPKTGDGENTGLYLAFGFAALIFAIGTLVYKRKTE